MSMWHDDRTERDYLSGGGRRRGGDSGGGRRGREWDQGKDFSRARDRSRSPARRSGGGGGRAEPECRVFVGNLPYSVSWQDLKDHMRQAGDVTYAKVMQDFNGKSRGCGIVEYSSKGDAKKAIKEMHDSELDGRAILVREDREDDSRGGRGGAPRDRGEGRSRGDRQERTERGSRREGGRDRRERKPREEVTAEMLDNEMDSYFESKAKKPEASNGKEKGDAAAEDAMDVGEDLQDVLDE